MIFRGCRRRRLGARCPAHRHVALDARGRKREGRANGNGHAARVMEKWRTGRQRSPRARDGRESAANGVNPVMSWSSMPPGRSPKGWASTWKRASRLSRSRATRPAAPGLRADPIPVRQRHRGRDHRPGKKKKGQAKVLLRGTRRGRSRRSRLGRIEGPAARQHGPRPPAPGHDPLRGRSRRVDQAVSDRRWRRHAMLVSGSWPNRSPPFTRPAPTRNAGWTECWRKKGLGL